MKCAFEDAGFKIVEEIDWVYLTGMPKNQDIGKLFDKAEGKKRPLSMTQRPIGGKNGVYIGQGGNWGETINVPQSDDAKKWNGWKTAGLKPAHEPITIFQKPLDGNYVHNIKTNSCGGMNIDACRVPISKASKNPTTNYSDTDTRVYGKYAEDKASPANEQGRFPANMVLDVGIAEELDEQTGRMVSKRSHRGIGFSNSNIFGNGDEKFDTVRGYNDIGGGSKNFIVIKYCQKVSPSERKLPNGERNPHVTLKPVELIKWLIKLLTPIDGTTLDITAGSCTHAVACEQLNRDNGYNLKYIDIELQNTKDDPYCNVGKMRVEEFYKDKNIKVN